MKIIHSILILIFLTACNGSDSQPVPTGGDVLTIKASGLASSVTLFETISGRSHEISGDGIFDINLPLNQTIYDLEIVDSNQQRCTLNDQLDLTCDESACPATFIPVCAKKPSVAIQCQSGSCPTAQYLTFSNSCFADLANSWSAISTECGELEGVLGFRDQKPTYITNLPQNDIDISDFDVINYDIVDDTLKVELQVSGGCGSHAFRFYADEVFIASDPVQLSATIFHIANDACDNLIRIEKEFDLLPIKEIYRRAYPQSTGENSVVLSFGTYRFTLD